MLKWFFSLASICTAHTYRGDHNCTVAYQLGFELHNKHTYSYEDEGDR